MSDKFNLASFVIGEAAVGICRFWTLKIVGICQQVLANGSPNEGSLSKPFEITQRSDLYEWLVQSELVQSELVQSELAQ